MGIFKRSKNVAPAGWYQDPEGSGRQRWWNGEAWTGEFHPRLDHTPQPSSFADLPGHAPSGVAVEAGIPSGVPADVDGVSDTEAQDAAMSLDNGAVRVPSTVLEKPRGGLFNGGKKALEEENADLRRALEAIGATERERLKVDIDRLRAEHARTLAATRKETLEAQAELSQLQAQVIVVRDELVLQEVGIYDYRHPLDSALAYKGRLAAIRDEIKTAARTGDAVVGQEGWTVNGSAAEGRRMYRDLSKLMLRAYNNEADTAVRSMKPYQVASSVARLEKARDVISKLGTFMGLHVTPGYHRLRVTELELTADYLAKVAEEREQEREEKARLREEEQARREYEREKAKLLKEASHYEAVLARLRASGDHAAVDDAEARLAEVQASLDGVEERAANIRAGYVYVISNFGSFGERMVKIGMTRRLDPMDRVRELGDASVPFRYDVHALIFSQDAVSLETNLHQALAHQRVNLVNNRREFFYATPGQVRDLLADLQGSLLSFDEQPEALEWRQSENSRLQTDDTQTVAALAGSSVGVLAD